MNLKSLLLLSSILICTICYSQKIIVNADIEVTTTKISIKNENYGEDRLFCYDYMRNDSITVYVSKPVLEGCGFKLQTVNGKIIPKVYKCTDYPAYDGMSCVDLENDKYTLEINNTVFKPGDTLKAKFTILTKTHKYSEKKKVTGEIFHIIGGNQYEWREGKSIHYKFWKNGKQVFTTNEEEKQ